MRRVFGETDLPLALIMEEILEWEKRPEEDRDPVPAPAPGEPPSRKP